MMFLGKKTNVIKSLLKYADKIVFWLKPTMPAIGLLHVSSFSKPGMIQG